MLRGKVGCGCGQESDLVAGRVGKAEIDVAPETGAQGFGEGRRIVADLVQLFEEVFEEADADAREDRVLVLKVEVDGGRGVLDLLGNLADRETFGAFLLR